MARREGVADEAGERRLGDDGELAGGGKARAGERARHENQGVVYAQRVGSRRAVAVEQIRAEADPADEPLQDVVGQGFVPSGARGEIDDQCLSEVAAHA